MPASHEIASIRDSRKHGLSSPTCWQRLDAIGAIGGEVKSCKEQASAADELLVLRSHVAGAMTYAKPSSGEGRPKIS